jgi:DNA-binding IscR family transcriptional regulator
MDLVKSTISNKVNPEKGKDWLTEPQLKKLAHLPLLTCFYLLFQKRFSATPVTPLELSAYLGLDVAVTEGLLASMEKKGWLTVFKEGLPAYSLAKDLDQITAADLIELVGRIQELVKQAGSQPDVSISAENAEKYRKIYSDLASEMLQLFGEQPVNKLPV